MTDLQHDHIQRDLEAVKTAAAKLAAAAEKATHARQLHEDAKRAYDVTVAKFHGTVQATKAIPGGIASIISDLQARY